MTRIIASDKIRFHPWKRWCDTETCEEPRTSAFVENGAHPIVSVIYFKPNPHKKGNHYERFTGIVKKVNALEKKLIFFGSENTIDKRISTIDIQIKRIIEISMQTVSVK